MTAFTNIASVLSTQTIASLPEQTNAVETTMSPPDEHEGKPMGNLSKMRKSKDYKDSNKSKSVSFSDVVQIHHVLNIEGYTVQEVKNTWWQSTDYHKMKSNVDAIVKSVQSTRKIPIVDFDLTDRMEFRGLEDRIESDRIWRRIDAAIETVLYSKKGNDGGADDADTVSDSDESEIVQVGCCRSSSSLSSLPSYSFYSQLALKEAQINGLLDELSALKSLEQDIEDESSLKVAGAGLRLDVSADCRTGCEVETSVDALTADDADFHVCTVGDVESMAAGKVQIVESCLSSTSPATSMQTSPHTNDSNTSTCDIEGEALVTVTTRKHKNNSNSKFGVARKLTSYIQLRRRVKLSYRQIKR